MTSMFSGHGWVKQTYSPTHHCFPGTGADRLRVSAHKGSSWVGKDLFTPLNLDSPAYT